MERRSSKGNSDGSESSSWLDSLKSKTKSVEEKVVAHTPNRDKNTWQYNLTEGGQKYKVSLPTTEEQIAKVKEQLLYPKNWRRYHRSPYGGDVNYTQINCFPPFDFIRVAEVFLPNGEVWSSRKRRFIKPEEDGD